MEYDLHLMKGCHVPHLYNLFVSHNILSQPLSYSPQVSWRLWQQTREIVVCTYVLLMECLLPSHSLLKTHHQMVHISRVGPDVPSMYMLL